MNTYIALLRGINVSGQKKIKIADLRAHLHQWGFMGAKTYIQSGNIVLQSPLNAKAVKEIIENGIQTAYGFQVPTLVVSLSDLESVFKENPFNDLEDIAQKRVYFVLLYYCPKMENVNALLPGAYPNEDFVITENCLYLLCKQGMGQAKLTNNVIERKLGVTATARNYQTLQKLIEMAR